MQEVVLKKLYEMFRFVTLTHKDYLKAVEAVVARGFVSGMIYDALVLEAAKKSGAKVLYTWNLRHFSRFQSTQIRIESPV